MRHIWVVARKLLNIGDKWEPYSFRDTRDGAREDAKFYNVLNNVYEYRVFKYVPERRKKQ